MTHKEIDEKQEDEWQDAKTYYPFAGQTLQIPPKTDYFDFDRWLEKRLAEKNAQK